MSSNDHPGRDELLALHVGRLPSAVLDAVAEHLNHCPACSSLLDELAPQAAELLPELSPPVAGVPRAAEPVAGAEAGARLGQYQLLEELGAGGMGRVFRARHELMGRIVALKVIHGQRLDHPEGVGRFRREIEALARLSHPNIVAALDANLADGMPFLVMEYVAGTDLDRLVRARGPLPVAEACDYVRQAALGLQHAHENGLVHRDVKPANLLRTPSGQVKLLDLGLALFWAAPPAAPGHTDAGQVLGTADYMAPEQAAATHAVGVRADVYGLGCTLYHLLTGEPPFRGTGADARAVREAHAGAPVPDVRARRADIPDDLARWLQRLLAKDPAHRPTAAETAEALDAFVDRRRLRVPSRRRRRTRLAVAVVAIGLVGIGAAASLPWFRTRVTETAPSLEPPAALAVKELRVEHRRGDPSVLQGDLGKTSQSTVEGDDVRVHVRLTGPAHCFLIAFNPDGSEQLCYPHDGAVPPPVTAAFVYPAERADPKRQTYFCLTDGTGLQAFVLVASREPLPAYADWRARVGAPPWQRTEADGVWDFDRQAVRPLRGERGQEQLRDRHPAAFADLCRFFAERPGVEAVAAVAFPVKRAPHARASSAPLGDGRAIDAAWEARTRAKLDTLSQDERAKWSESGGLLFRANVLRRMGRSTDACPLVEEALRQRCKLLGDDSPHTAHAYGELACTLDETGRYAEAEPLHRKALRLRLELLSERHDATARSYNDLAANLRLQGRLAEARPLYQQALELRRRLWRDDPAHTALGYNNLASCLCDQGRYAEAEALFREALKRFRVARGDRDKETVGCLGNMAAAIDLQQRHTEARPLHEQVLKDSRRLFGKDAPFVARALSALAGNLYAQGDVAGAERFFVQALDIRRDSLGDGHPDTADSYEDLATCRRDQGRHTEAETLYRKVLAVRRRRLGDGHWATVLGYVSVGCSLYAQGKFAEAEQTWLTAANQFEEERRRMGCSGLERVAAPANPAPLLAGVLVHNRKPLEAWRRLEAGLGRGLLDDLWTRQARRLSAADRDRQRQLADALRDLDKLFAARTARTDRGPCQDDDLVQLRLRQGELQVKLARFEADLDRRYGVCAGQVADLAAVQTALPADAALLAWVDIEAPPHAQDAAGDHWVCVVRPQGRPAWVSLNGDGPGRSWSRSNREGPARLAREVARRPTSDPGGWQREAASLARQRFDPVLPLLAGNGALPPVRRLVVLPSPGLAGLPVEVLLRPDDGYSVSYAPSATVLAWLRTRPRASLGRRLNLLALADPASSPVAPETVLGGASPITAFANRLPLAADPFAPLPGSRREVEALEQVFRAQDSRAEVLTLVGSTASEERLTDLASRRQLAPFRYIHLATHGEADSRRALQSALILARDHLPDPLQQVLAGRPVYDGRLTAEQVLRDWDLDADMVVLSGCETGLGTPGRGDGTVGFAQAFLLAGARAVVLSLWKVDDTATALLMRRFYQNLLGARLGLSGPLSKAEALGEAKIWLRGLTAEEIHEEAARLPRIRGRERERWSATPAAAAHPYEHPYYWAAFILLGDPD